MLVTVSGTLYAPVLPPGHWIIPTEFERYAIERTAELSAFGECGIIEMAPEFDERAGGGGRTVELPFWKDLTATRQLLSDSASLTVNKITADTDPAPKATASVKADATNTAAATYESRQRSVALRVAKNDPCSGSFTNSAFRK